MPTINEKATLGFAVELGEWLVTWLSEPDLATIDGVDAVFGNLENAVEALPPTVADASLMCYLRNRVPSSRKLWSNGEWGTAKVQMQELTRKLTRRRAALGTTVPVEQPAEVAEEVATAVVG